MTFFSDKSNIFEGDKYNTFIIYMELFSARLNPGCSVNNGYRSISEYSLPIYQTAQISFHCKRTSFQKYFCIYSFHIERLQSNWDTLLHISKNHLKG